MGGDRRAASVGDKASGKRVSEIDGGCDSTYLARGQVAMLAEEGWISIA